MTPRLWTVRQIATEYAVAPETVRRWIRSGALRALHVGRAWKVRDGDLQAFVAAQGGTAEAQAG